MSQFGCWVVNSPIPRIYSKDLGEDGTVHTWWRQQNNISGGGIFCHKRDTGEIILGNNPAGHCIILDDLVPSYDCVSENASRRHKFL